MQAIKRASQLRRPAVRLAHGHGIAGLSLGARSNPQGSTNQSEAQKDEDVSVITPKTVTQEEGATERAAITASQDQKKPKGEGMQKKTMAELDEELRQKMSGIAGDGGASGVEYEDGKPVAMKRGVRNNMFRYI